MLSKIATRCRTHLALQGLSLRVALTAGWYEFVACSVTNTVADRRGKTSPYLVGEHRDRLRFAGCLNPSGDAGLSLCSGQDPARRSISPSLRQVLLTGLHLHSVPTQMYDAASSEARPANGIQISFIDASPFIASSTTCPQPSPNSQSLSASPSAKTDSYTHNPHTAHKRPSSTHPYSACSDP